MLIENIYEHLLSAFPGGRQLRYTPKEIRINHDWAGLDVHIHVHLYTLWLGLSLVFAKPHLQSTQ